MSRIRSIPPQKGGNIKKASASDAPMNFSFKFFDESDEELCPPNFKEGYTRALMLRLRVLSVWTGEKFRGKIENNIRNHIIDWNDTARACFSSVNMEHRDTPAYQFAVTEYAHGRVHGFFIGDTFYVIWLDCNHALYPGENENNA